MTTLLAHCLEASRGRHAVSWRRERRHSKLREARDDYAVEVVAAIVSERNCYEWLESRVKRGVRELRGKIRGGASKN